MKTEKIQNSVIRIDGGTQVRESIHSAVVTEYAEAMKAGAEFPPVMLFRDDKGALWLADGFHRVYAAREAGIEKIDCHVRPGSQRDALLWAAGANADHGIRRTNADKRRAVLTLLNDPEWSKWSDRKIAGACFVSQPFVSGLRRSDNGYHSDTSPRDSGSKTKVRQSDDDAPDPAQRPSAGLLDDSRIDDPEVGDQEHEDAVTFGKGTAWGKGKPAETGAASVTPPPPPLDAKNRPLPEKFRPIFEDGVGKFDAALAFVAQAKRHIDGLLNNADGLAFFLGAKRITADLKNLKSELEAGRPYSLCPTCAAKGCKACDGKGWVNKIMYEHAGESTVRLFEKKRWGSKA